MTLYADGVPIGSGIANGPNATITTDGATTIADGTHAITARQTQGGVQSALSDPINVTIDTAGPTVRAPREVRDTLARFGIVARPGNVRLPPLPPLWR